MKLNLASGTDLKPLPWINLDVVARWPGTSRGCDVIWDARKDKIPYDNESVDEIYASYLLLHLAPRFHKPVLAEIHRVLMPGGVLVVGEVDMRKVMTKWLEAPSDPGLADLIWGEQAVRPEWPIELADELVEFDKHCQGFTEESLKKTLTDSGFTNFTPLRLHVVFYELTLACRKI
jgi:ubiquinone/menaquinone biosynthesis C-methylase UbiE